MDYNELAAEYQRALYSHQVSADELAKALVEVERLRARVHELETRAPADFFDALDAQDVR